MTTIRRAAQLVEDLTTLGTIKNEDVSSCLSLCEKGISVVIGIPKSENNRYYTVKYAFEQEFDKEVHFIEDSEFLQILLV